MEDLMLFEILKEMQNKYNCIVEIERITREIGESLTRNDRTSAQMLLGMRQEEMDKADVHDRNMKYLISVLSPAEAFCIREWQKGNAGEKPLSANAEKLVEKGKDIRAVLKRTIEADCLISTRLAGQDSYYRE